MLQGIINIPWLPSAVTALTVISRYGAGLLVGVLTLLGVPVTLNETAWTATIGVLALLAATLIAVSSWRHRTAYPAGLAGTGLALVLWTMYGTNSRSIELVGFAVLIAATALDWRARSTALHVASEEASWIEVPELADRLGRKPMPVVLDVRGTDEFTGELGHIAGARNISLGELPRRLDEIANYKSDQIVLVCKTQMRSAKAAALLRERGFRHVAVLRGGMVAWVRQHGFRQAP